MGTELNYQPLHIVLCEKIIPHDDEVAAILPDAIPAFAKPKVLIFRNAASYKAGLQILDNDETLDIVKTYDVDFSQWLTYNGDGTINTVYLHQILLQYTLVMSSIIMEALLLPRIKNWLELETTTAQERERYMRETMAEQQKKLEEELCYVMRDIGAIPVSS